jgi:ABC-type Na+ efflux pump permease subunit
MQIVNQVQFHYCWLYLVWDGMSSHESELSRIASRLPDGIARALVATALAQVKNVTLTIRPGMYGPLRPNGTDKSRPKKINQTRTITNGGNRMAPLSKSHKTTKTGNTAYRAAIGVALAAVFILVWLSLGVGIIGKDGDPANLMYGGVLAIGIVGAIIARFRPHGMARALVAMALAQALIAVIALIAGLGYPWSGPLEIVALNGFFVALFVGSALLFRKAAREQSPAGAGLGG